MRHARNSCADNLLVGKWRMNPDKRHTMFCLPMRRGIHAVEMP